MEWTDLLAQFGVPAVIALFLVWWTTTQLSEQVQSLGKHIEKNTNAVIMLATVIARERNIDLEEVRKLRGGNGNEEV